MAFQTILKKFVLSLIGRWLKRGWKEGWVHFDQPVQSGWPEELKVRFLELSRNMMIHSPGLEEGVDDWSGTNFTRFWAEVVEASLQGDKLANKWTSLDEIMLLAPEEISLLAVMVVIYHDWPMLRALRFAMSEQNPDMPRWGFVTQFLSDSSDMTLTEQTLSPQNSQLFKSGILTLGDGVALSSAEISILPEVARYLMDSDSTIDGHLDAVPVKSLEDSARVLVKKVPNRPVPKHIVISGARGSGKVQLSRSVACRMGFRGVIVLDLTPVQSLEMARKAIMRALALAVLEHDAVVFNNVSRWSSRWGDSTLQLVDVIEAAGTLAIWLVTSDVPDFVRVSPDCIIRLAMPGRKQREKLWLALTDGQLEENWIAQLAGQFLLTRGQIETVIERTRASEETPAHGEAHYLNLARHARAISQEGPGSLATPEPARVTMDQLIVSDECSTALQDLLMYAKHRRELAKNWGFERSMPYGLGLAALFCGPPGTGKTYGAQVIATELQLELYRVDLSQLVSKYIGETEKHLGELFNAAEQGEILLLFDEADSVFSKRTEVKSSVDRYANLEVNYLLQRLERFSGVSILTSNFESGIDEAFMRRIRFKVPFDLPEEKSRLALWNKFLSPAIPRSRDVSLSKLAHIFELSGGHIKEAVLRAASIAYGTPEKVVTQELLMRSAELEYRKLGKLMPQSDDDGRDFSRWN